LIIAGSIQPGAPVEKKKLAKLNEYQKQKMGFS